VKVERANYRVSRTEVIGGSLPDDPKDARIAQLERELIEARSTIQAIVALVDTLKHAA
jgi:hypothetical protein